MEHAFEEERRRDKFIPRFRREKESLKLVFGTLWRARGLRATRSGATSTTAKPIV